MSLDRYVLAALVLLATGPNLLAQPTQPLSQRAGSLPLSAVDVIALPEVDNEALRDRDEARMSTDQPEALQFAEPFDFDFSPRTHGTWEVIDGHRVWRLVVTSPGAYSINLGFSRFHLPTGAALWLYPAGQAPSVRAFTSADHQDHGQLWTPIIPGHAIVVELNLPGAHPAQDHELDIGRISHAYRPFGIPGADLMPERSGACNVDVICPEGDDHRDIIRSVATFSRGGSRVCSAVAVNNTAQDGTPFVLTAQHCGMEPGNAPSMVVYWNYENSFCRPPNTSGAGGPGDGSLAQFSTGATFRGSGSASDWALVELNQELDVEFDVFLAGWDRRDQATSSAIAVHHPRVQEKRISFENNPTQITNYLQSSPSPTGTHVHVIDWDLGTTEPGSSGSPLFSPEKRVIGQLHGGYAACSNNLADWYGRVYHSMNTGLAQWLDPGASGLAYIDGLESGIVLPELPEVPGGTTRAMAFDGSTSLTAGPSPFFPREDDLGLSMWATIDAPGTLAELATDDGVAFRLEVVDQGGEHVLRYMHQDANGAEVAHVFDQTYVSGGRHHIALSRGDDPAAVRLFLDGRRVGQPFFYPSSPPISSQRILHIGDSAGRSGGVSAVLDEIRLYRDRVTLAELRAVMHESIPLDEMPPALIAYYRFEADTTDFAYDFSNHGSSAAVGGDNRIASPFPVGEVGRLLSSSATPSGYVGSEGLRLTATATSPLGSGNQLGLYLNPASDDIVQEDGLPDDVIWRSETIWGAFAYGDVSADLMIEFGNVAQHAETASFRLLHRASPHDEWTDATVAWTGGEFDFSIENTSLFGEWSIGYAPGVGTGDDGLPEGAYILETAFPNPFSSTTTLSLAVRDAQDVTAVVYDALGRRVQVLFDGALPAGGEHPLVLEGAGLPNGLYVVRVTGETFTVAQKVTLVR